MGIVVSSQDLSNHPVPSCKRAATKHVAQAALDAARREIGLPTPAKLYYQWDAFFDMMPPQCAVFGVRGHCALFVPIFKAANDQIRGSLLEGLHDLQRREGAEYGNYFTLDHSSCYSHERHPPPMPKWSHLPYLNDVCYESLFTFTFTREPLSHFLAGYGEFIWRTYAQDRLVPELAGEERRNEIIKIRRKMVDEKNDPVGLVIKVVDGSMIWAGNNELHMGLMSGAFNNAYGKFDFVGTIANIEADFAHVLRRAKLESSSSSSSSDANVQDKPKVLGLRAGVGTHDSTLDELEARKDLHHVLATNHSLRRALCHVLSPDYHCFSYSFRACLNGSALGVHA